MNLFEIENMGVIYYLAEFFLVGPVALLFLLYLLSTTYRVIPLMYAIWWLYDRRTVYREGRRSGCVRSWRIWNWYRDYFPAALIKTTELSPEKNYIMGFHPHGVLVFGAFLNFATEATGFSAKFPGIKAFLCTLKLQFVMPLHRELLLWTG